MRRRFIAMVVVVALSLFMVAGCGGSNSNTGGQTQQPPAAPPPSSGNPNAPAPPPPIEVVDPGAEDDTLVQTRTQVLDLTFAHPFPGTHHHHVDVIIPFVDAFMEATEGMVNIILQPGGTLTTGQTALDDITQGSIDIVWTVQGYSPGRFPLSEMFEFQNAFTSGAETAEVMWDMLENNEELAAEYSDYKLFCLLATDISDIWTKGKQVRVPADLAGVSLRAPSAMVERTLQAAGAATANMSMPEAYDNIDRGIVSGLGAGCSAIPTYNLWEVLDYGTHGLNLYVSLQMMAMSWSAWNKLNEFEQAAFERLSGRVFSVPASKYYDDMGAAALQMIIDYGVEMTMITDEDLAVWREAIAPAQNEYIASLIARGYDAQTFYDQMISFRDARR